jgi:hypothetical protein
MEFNQQAGTLALPAGRESLALPAGGERLGSAGLCKTTIGR